MVECYHAHDPTGHEKVLHSHAIWPCTTCYSCPTRCLGEIESTKVMVSLRSLAIARGGNARR